MWKCISILGLGKYFVVFKLLNSDDRRFYNLMWVFTESADFLGLFIVQTSSFCLKPAWHHLKYLYSGFDLFNT